MANTNNVIGGRFHLRQQRPEGSWGELFDADDKTTYGKMAASVVAGGNHTPGERSVVVEVVRPTSLGVGVTLDAISREMKAFKDASDLNFLECLEYRRETKGTYAGSVYLAMESWEDSLADAIQKASNLTDEEIDLIARAVSQGLASLHERD